MSETMDKSKLAAAIALIGSLFSMHACAENEGSETSRAIAISELGSARDDLEVYRILVESGVGVEAAEVRVAQSLMRHVLTIGAQKPDISALRGKNLETLCLLTEQRSREIPGRAGGSQFYLLANEYLDSIEDAVRAEIAESQAVLGGSGCFLTQQPT